MVDKNEAVIVEALRTPVGKKQGVFSSTRSDDLGAVVLRGLLDKTQLDPRDIDDVVSGCVTQTMEQGVNITRNMILAAGLPIEITGTTVNRLCGSGLQAINFGAATVTSGYDEILCCMGFESMNRVPMGSDMGPMNEKMLDRFGIVNQGESAELVAKKWELDRKTLDLFSQSSHERAIKAIDLGQFKREIVEVQVGDKAVKEDETPRRGSSLEKLSKLKPSFLQDGLITAGNSSQISDGAAGVIIMSRKKAEELNLKPRARFVSTATAGVDPTIMLTGPIPSTEKALKKAGLTIKDIDFIECNEAFASVPIAFAKTLGVDSEKLNPRGGAIALGHPLGSTGARLMTTLLHTLEDEDKRYGLVTMCIGFGQGITTIIERI